MPVDRNGVIKSHPFDHRWRPEVSPRVLSEESRHFYDPLDLHPAIMMSRGVHRSRSIFAVITREINGSDDFIIFI